MREPSRGDRQRIVDRPSEAPEDSERGRNHDGPPVGDTDQHPDRRSAVLDRLDRVTDPELDRSIVELGYVAGLRVGAETFVRLSLPTAWCSPAFAWMMASDARGEVESIEGVDRAIIKLVDHMHAEEITRGVNARRSFSATFEDAAGEVDAVRARLDRKARLARQHHAVETLLEAGLRPSQICDLRRRDVTFDSELDRARLRLGDVIVSVQGPPLESYLEKATSIGLVDGPAARVFAGPDGEPVSATNFETVHRRARAARVNQRGQAAVCSALHDTRHGRDGGMNR